MLDNTSVLDNLVHTFTNNTLYKLEIINKYIFIKNVKYLPV